MKCLLLYILTLISIFARSQNLVPNGSFESYTDCPTAATFYKVMPWCGLGGGEDSFNKCFSDLYGPGGNGVPETTVGFQYARTGYGFGSVLLYTPDPLKTNLREYLHVPLINPLLANKTYCGTFYVNLINESKYSTDRIGMALTSNSYACNQAMPNPQAIPTISITPQVENPAGNLITDTLGWVEVAATFTATGTEAYLTIGNFYNDASTSSNLFNPSASRTILFLLIDDVSIEEVFPVRAKNDTLIMQSDSIVVGNNTSEAALYSWQPLTGLNCTNCANPKASPTITTTYTVTKTQCKAVTTDEITVSVSPTGTNELNINNAVSIIPNPTNGFITISSRYDLEAVELISITGQGLFSEAVHSKEYHLQLQGLIEGIYFVKCIYANGMSVTKKIVKQ